MQNKLPDLYPYQTEHYHRILDILEKNKIAIDVSCTGSGKTMVALHVIKKNLLDVDGIIIVSPPTLINHWQNYVNYTDKSTIEIFSSHSLHKFDKKKENYLLIVDECHLFKNSVKRTGYIKRMINQSKYCLMLSATPYDDIRQYSNIKELFAIKNSIKEHISAMDFKYDTQTEMSYFHIIQDETQSEEYEKGIKTIRSSTTNRGNNETVFRPSLFCSGLQRIHDSLIEGCVRYLEAKLQEDDKTKFIIVVHFIKHFEYIQETLSEYDVLILNGSVSLEDRKKNIEKFQKNDTENRIICISDEVGSVGIELDDKTGEHPRHMVILPMSNSINFCQAIGRIQRTQTKSNSLVSIIQPNKNHTYFKMQIERKFKVLEQFLSIPVIDNKYEI
jgi:superfamily II DNA or RNA helicase